MKLTALACSASARGIAASSAHSLIRLSCRPMPAGCPPATVLSSCPGKVGLSYRPPRHPDMHAVLASDVARHVRPEGAYAEPRHRRALHRHQRRAGEFPGDRIGLLAPQALEVALLAQLQQEAAQRGRALVRRVERGIEMPGLVAAGEQVGPLGHDGREVAMEEARAIAADEPRLELAEAGVVAALDMVEERHRLGDSIPSLP